MPQTVASCAVRSYRTLSPLPALTRLGGLLSAALVVGSRRPDVTWHPALWSPDFPDEEGDHHLVCVDTQSDAVSETEGEPLFSEDGKPAPLMADKQELLALLLEGEPQTKAFIKALVELELLTPIALDIAFIDGSSKKVEGIYTIDEDRLAGLYGETVAILHERGFLAPAYTMLASHAHIYSLIERKNSKLSKK